MLRTYRLRIVFFMETKLDKKCMEMFRKRCGFMYRFEVFAMGTRGGLCLAWHEEIVVSLKSYSINHIDV